MERILQCWELTRFSSKNAGIWVLFSRIFSCHPWFVKRLPFVEQVTATGRQEKMDPKNEKATHRCPDHQQRTTLNQGNVWCCYVVVIFLCCVVFCAQLWRYRSIRWSLVWCSVILKNCSRCRTLCSSKFACYSRSLDLSAQQYMIHNVFVLSKYI